MGRGCDFKLSKTVTKGPGYNPTTYIPKKINYVVKQKSKLSMVGIDYQKCAKLNVEKVLSHTS